MNREGHVRFWEGRAVRFRWATQLPWSKAKGKRGRLLFRRFSWPPARGQRRDKSESPGEGLLPIRRA